jgi:hypothetical protein
MIARMLLPLLLIGPLLVLWLPMARTRRARLVVAAILTAVIAAAVLLSGVLPRSRFEITLFALLAAVALITVMTIVEQRRRGSRPQPPRIWWVRTLAAVALMVALGLFGVLIAPRGFIPPVEDVLPLPDGLTAVAAPGSCGSSVCTRSITVTGRPGQSTADLETEIARHLVARGWTTECRPAGWLLDRGTTCARRNGLTITLSGGS